MCECEGRPAPDESRRVHSRRWRTPRWLPQFTLTKLERAVKLLLLVEKASNVLEKHGGPHVGTLAEVLDAIVRMLAG